MSVSLDNTCITMLWTYFTYEDVVINTRVNEQLKNEAALFRHDIQETLFVATFVTPNTVTYSYEKHK